MQTLKKFWGSVDLTDGFYSESGIWVRGLVNGFLEIISADKLKVGTDKWSILVRDKPRSEIRIVLLGCKIKNIIRWKKQSPKGIPINSSPDIYDVRRGDVL